MNVSHWLTRLNPFKNEQRTSGQGLTYPHEWLDQSRGAGEVVNENTCLSIPALYRAVDLVSSKVASLEACFVRTNPADDSRTKLRKHKGYRLLNQAPNDLYSAYHFKKVLIWHAMIHGNGIAWIYRDEYGDPTEAYLLNPVHCYLRYMGQGWDAINQGGWYIQTVVYITQANEAVSATTNPVPESLSGAQSKTVFIPLADCLIVRALGDGLLGFSIISLMRQALGEQIAQQVYAGSRYANGLNPGMAITLPMGLRDEADIIRFRSSLEGAHVGAGKAFRTLLLENGATIAPITMSAKAAEFISSRQFGIQLISQVTGVPVHLLAGQIATSYNSIEAQGQEFLQFTLDSWLNSLEAEAGAKLLSEQEKQSGLVEVEFDRRKLVMIDTATRVSVLTTELNNGGISQNEYRAEFGRPPIGPDGDKFRMPTNVGFVDMMAHPPPPPVPQIIHQSDPNQEDKDKPEEKPSEEDK